MKTDYDHHANFPKYHTDYREKVKTLQTPRGRTEFRMRLTTYCNRKVGSEWTTVGAPLSPPLAALVTSRNTNAFMTVGGGWRWAGVGETTTQLENYPIGSLVLDFYDAHHRQLIWRGRVQ